MKPYVFHPTKKHAESSLEIASQALNGGSLKVMPAAFYKQFDQEALTLFAISAGLYCLPTVELLDTLNGLIMEVSPTRSAIEIGSGNGAISRGLGILGTDNFMQDSPEIAALYAAQNRPTITYSKDLVRIDANSAVETYRPDVVLGSWVTHLYNPAESWRKGNMMGVDEAKILKAVKRYIIVGNHGIHADKPIMKDVTRVIEADYIFSVSLEHQFRNAIFVWDGQA